MTYVGWYGAPRRQDWQTPAYLFDPLDAEYRFNLDGAAEDGNALLAAASTPERPVSWGGQRVFCNPPWSAITQFVELAPSAELAVLLVPARVNARWFHRALELGAAVRYFVKRPSFHNERHKGTGHNSPVDCLLLVFDPGRAALASPAEPGLDVERLRLAFRGYTLDAGEPDVIEAIARAYAALSDPKP